jgi:membrane protein YqaA with SNARE-associated domain
MEEWVFQLGYLGLFLVSFLSATILPMTSVVFVLALPPLGYNPWAVLVVATAGNYFGALVNYYIGRYGGDFFLSRWIKVEHEKMKKAEAAFNRFGVPMLFFSWLPVIGDMLTIGAGTLRVRLDHFTFWTVSGKAANYAFALGALSIVLERFPEVAAFFPAL